MTSVKNIMAAELQRQILHRRDLIARCRGLLPLGQCEAIVAAVLDHSGAIAGAVNEQLGAKPRLVRDDFNPDRT